MQRGSNSSPATLANSFSRGNDEKCAQFDAIFKVYVGQLRILILQKIIS